MCVLDEADLHILKLLAEDARRPFSDISAEVGLSAPTVPDRIDHLREEGIIRHFTVDLDQPTLSDGMPILVRLPVRPESVDEIHDALRVADPVQHLFVAADGEVATHARSDGGSVRVQLDELINLPRVRDYQVSLAEPAEWSPTVSGTGLIFERAECDNTVVSEDESARIGGPLYHFCCSSCLGQFRDRYNHLEAGANDDWPGR